MCARKCVCVVCVCSRFTVSNTCEWLLLLLYLEIRKTFSQPSMFLGVSHLGEKWMQNGIARRETMGLGGGEGGILQFNIKGTQTQT